MEKDDFEEKLTRMTKPEVSQLKHQDMIEKAISGAKDKSALSLWWLLIPLYIISMFIMKSMFMPAAKVGSSLHELTIKQNLGTYTLFIALPLVLIILNILSIRKVHLILRSPMSDVFLKAVWLNIVMIAFSIVILIIYL